MARAVSALPVKPRLVFVDGRDKIDVNPTLGAGSGPIVDAFLAENPEARVAAECLRAPRTPRPSA